MKQYQADSSLNRKQRRLLFNIICVQYTKFWPAVAARIKLKYIFKIVIIFPKPRGWVWTIRMVRCKPRFKKCSKLVLDKLTLKHYCIGPQTNMPQNVGSIEDLVSKNIQSRHIEF